MASPARRSPPAKAPASKSSRGGSDGLGGDLGPAAVKGGFLIVVALIIGVLLLNQGTESGEVATADTPADETDDTTPATSPDTTDGTSPTTDGDTTTSAPESRPPEEVTVQVANGSGIAGAAQTVQDELTALGYVAPDLGPGSASAPVTTTAIYYISGYEAEAAAVAEDLGLAPADAVQGEVPEPVPTGDGSMRGAQVLVILGPDVAPTTSGGTAAVTTTTVAGTSGTTPIG